MIRVGLTGGIGAGKSTVARAFETLGAKIYEADLRARIIMEADAEVVRDLKNLLGEEAYNDEGLDRKWVAQRIFGDQRLLQGVNSIVHPKVAQDWTAWNPDGAAYLLLESAILFESGFDALVDYTVTIEAPIVERVRRASARDGVSEEMVMRRVEAQMSDSERTNRADFAIDNSDNAAVLPSILRLHNFFLGNE